MRKNNFQYINISGSGRSGTNITKELISMSNDVFTLPFEYRFTIDPYGLIDTYNTMKFSWSPFLAHSRISELERYLTQIGQKNYFKFLIGKIIKTIDKKGLVLTPPRYFDWELQKWFPNYLKHVEYFKKRLVDFEYNAAWPGEKLFQIHNRMNFVAYDKQLNLIFKEFLDSLFSDILLKHNKTHFVEDNTWGILYAKELLEIIPEYKFIHVYRDPRDVVTSLLFQRWAPSEIDDCIKYYSSLMNKIIEIKTKLSSTQIIDVKLENLVENANGQLKQVCEFCEISFNQEMLNVDLSKGNSGRWKRDLNKSQQKHISQELDYFVEYFGYED